MTSEVASIKPNPYLFNIENRKRRRARLAHEIGEGAKCRKCQEKCAGFQLHFWRKICINCRCGKDDHEVEEDEEDIGQILIGKLFERPIRTQEEEKLYSFGAQLDILDKLTGKTQKLAFDWVPPGVAKDVAKKYMEQLPIEKRPIVGSEAAKKRKRQLEQQLPLYDVDETERCEDMPPEEYQNFQKYLKVLRTKVAGQAQIQEIVGLAPKQHAAILRSAADMDNFPSPPPHLEYAPIDASSSLPTPPLPPPPNASEFNFDSASHKLGQPSYPEAIENTLNNNDDQPKWRPVKFGNVNYKNRPVKSAHPFSANAIRDASTAMGGLELNNKNQFSLPAESAHLPIEEATLPSQNANFKMGNYRPNFELPKTERIYANEPSFIQQKNVNKSQAPSHKGNDALQQPTYNNVPSNMELNNVDQRPVAMAAAVGAQQDVKPSKQSLQKDFLKNQNDVSKPLLPRYEASQGPGRFPESTPAAYGGYIEKIKGTEFAAKSDNVNILLPCESKNLGTSITVPPANDEKFAVSSHVCQYCKEALLAGDVAVICERAGPDKFWHPSCFVCATCKELLADLIYFFKDEQVFCGRHYHEAASIPRCHACDELIFGESWTRADGYDWHVKHFCCFVCDEPLGGSKYIPDLKGYPHCISCYMSFLAKMCESCEEKITPDQPRLGYRGYYYHAQPTCFCCFRCHKSLIGVRFKMAKNWLFCSQDCVNLYADRIANNLNPKEKESV